MEDEHTSHNICDYVQEMLSNTNTTFDCVHVILQETIKSTKKNPCFLFVMWLQDGTQHILC